MASVTDICNRAVQKLGIKPISDISENSPAAKACNRCYEFIRDAELEGNRWNFAISRASLAADVPAPAWGRTNSFQLPSDCLKLIAPYPEWDYNNRDWVIEGTKILTYDAAPLYIRYVKKVTVVNEMKALFLEALAAKMALEMCEELTQSNSKKESLREDYKDAISKARKSNAIQNVPQDSVEDTWITCRIN